MTAKNMPALPAALALLTLLGIGCSRLILEDPLHIQEQDWPTYGRTDARENAADRTLDPPLKKVWECDISAGVGNGSPLVVDSVVFLGTLRGELYAIHVRTGKRIGSQTLGDGIQGSPAIDMNLAIVAESDTKESLIAYDLLDGKPRWKRDYGDIETSVLIYDGKIFVGNTAGTFSCVDRETGDLLWKFELPDNHALNGIRSTAAAAEGTVIFGADDGNVFALDAASGSVRWKHRADGAVVASPTIAGKTVLVGDLSGTMTAFDLATGATRWRFRADAPVRCNAALGGTLAVFGTLGGTVYALNTPDGTLAWKNAVNEPVNAAAVVAGDIAYVGTLKKTLLALSMLDGKEIWKDEMEGRIKTAPIVGYGMLFVATDERTLVAYQAENP